MTVADKIFPISIMALIVAFAGVHLGVGIGIIIPFRKFGDIWRPQIGLSAFNIVISFFGFLTGILGLVSIFMDSKIFSRIVSVISGILGVCALASLVAAIILNFQSLNYATSQFSNNMKNYNNNLNAKNSINLIQTKYQCCGADIWLDWAHAQLTVIAPATNVTSTTTIATGTTAAPQRSIRNVKQKRQTAETYGGIEGLPLTFSVVLPGSCCTSEAVFTDNILNSYCLSNPNNVTNHFNTGGCVKPLDVVVSTQLMGYGVINSIMLVLAFVGVPVLFKKEVASE